MTKRRHQARVIEQGYKPGPFVTAEIESIEIAEWSPEDAPGSQSTQVHLKIQVKGLPAPLTMRFKGPSSLTALTTQLIQYRNSVWPPAPDDQPTREALGQAVRRVWLNYCTDTGQPASHSHSAEWDDLSEWEQEVDRRIGEVLFQMGREYVAAGNGP